MTAGIIECVPQENAGMSFLPFYAFYMPSLVEKFHHILLMLS